MTDSTLLLECVRAGCNASYGYISPDAPCPYPKYCTSIQECVGRVEGIKAAIARVLKAEASEGMLSAGDSKMPQIAEGEDITTGRDALAEAYPAMAAALLKEMGLE